MTAVANLPSLQQNNRPRWDISNGQVTCDPINADKVARRYASKKIVQRPKTLPVIASLGSVPHPVDTAQTKNHVNGAVMSAPAVDNGTWATGGAKKKAQKPEAWLNRRSNSVSNFSTSSTRSSDEFAPNELISRCSGTTTSAQRSSNISSQKSNGKRSQNQLLVSNPPVLCLISMNGTFDRKKISVPFYPESVRIGRQTNTKTTPSPTNGYFDSKVLSRQHAELWADKNGIIWIKDIKSSNGTFVNGARLSLENRESEPHELEKHDQLDLGIDIVSEDQKTVVHHKVAAKVEYAGFAETLDGIDFDDVDNVTSTNIGLSQSQVQIRGKNELHNPVGNNKKQGTTTSITNNLISLGQQQQMKFWMVPVTVEQIVKRLTNEMRNARLQTNELEKTHEFLGSLLDMNIIGQSDRPIVNEAIKPSAFLNNMTRSEPTNCFSAPPAPPPQQPLPEKPDFARYNDYQSQASHIKQANIEPSTSVSGISQARTGTLGQVMSLMEALSVSKKEIESQNLKVRDLEELLIKEKKAREQAEEIAKQLELESETRRNGLLTVSLNQSEKENEFQPYTQFPKQISHIKTEASSLSPSTKTEVHNSESSDSMDTCLETIFAEIGELNENFATCNVHTEAATVNRNVDQKTLAEMVEEIRHDHAKRNKLSLDELGFSDNCSGESILLNKNRTDINMNQQGLKQTFKAQSPSNNEVLSTTGNLVKNNNYSEPLLTHYTAPFASMLGIVLIGVGIMSYLNGWHVIKVER